MKLYPIALIFFVFLPLNGCLEMENLSLTLLDRQVLADVPAASGIERIDDQYYAVGDNNPWLFLLNDQFGLVEKFHISPKNPVSDDILSKDVKPDFEAITQARYNGKHELWVFGSGSKSPSRDILSRFDLQNNKFIKAYALTEFYETIIASCNLGEGNLNIEAAAVIDENLYLFNRGINLVLQYPLNTLTAYLDGNAQCPKPLAYQIELPKTEQVQIGFSGATASADKKHFIFTASAEDTNNWIDDGEILGSYVGVISLKNLKNQYQPACLPIEKDGKILSVKVESVTVIAQNKKEIELLLVSDSDGGASERFIVKLD